MADNVALDASRVLIDVLERMTFLCGMSCPDEAAPEEIPGAIGASLTFKGPISGKVTIWTGADLLEEVGDVLGVSSDEARDTLGEIVNVFVGQMLTELGDDLVVFDLAIPEVRDADGAPWLEEDCCASCNQTVLIVEETPVVLRVCLAQ